LCARGYSKNAELVIRTHPTTSTTAQNAGASNEIVKGAQVTAVEGMTQVVSSFFFFPFLGFHHRIEYPSPNEIVKFSKVAVEQGLI